MTEEEHIRFGLGLPQNGNFVDKVLDAFDQLETIRRQERNVFECELKKLRKELDDYKQAYFDQWANQKEIEQTWAVIGNYNKQHLELHEAVREYIRNRESKYEDNLHVRWNNPSPEVRTIARHLARTLCITSELGIKLVMMGINSAHAMTGVILADLTMEGFTEEEAKIVLTAYENWEKNNGGKQ